MKTVIEGTLRFSFPTSWCVVKYDGEKDQPVSPNFYLRHLEPVNGTKAVDIVAAPPSPASRLTLLEVKDFRADDADLQHKIETEHFPLEVVQKALHTISGLYLGIRAQDPELLPLGVQLLGLPERLEVVLFLEQVPVAHHSNSKSYRRALDNRSRQRQGIAKRLRSALKPLGIATAVFDQATVPAAVGWQVEETA